MNQGEHTREPGARRGGAGHRHSAAARSAWTTPRSSNSSREVSPGGVSRAGRPRPNAGVDVGASRKCSQTPTAEGRDGGGPARRSSGGSSYDACAAQERPSRLSRADSTLAVRAAGVAGALLWLQPMPGGETSWRPIRAVERRPRAGRTETPRKTKRRLGRREGSARGGALGRAPRRRPAGGGRAGGGRCSRPSLWSPRRVADDPGRGSRTRLGRREGKRRPVRGIALRRALTHVWSRQHQWRNRPSHLGFVPPFSRQVRTEKIDGSRLVEYGGARPQARRPRFKYRDCQTREGARHTRPRPHAVAMSALQGVSVVVAIGAAAVGAGVTHAYHSGGGSRGPSRRRSSSVTLVDKTQWSRARRGARTPSPRAPRRTSTPRAWRSPRPCARRREDTSWTRTDAPCTWAIPGTAWAHSCSPARRPPRSPSPSRARSPRARRPLPR